MKILITMCMLLFSITGFTKERIALPESEMAEMTKLLELNTELHKSYFHYNAPKAQQNAAKIATAIDKLSNSEIKKMLNFAKAKLLDVKVSNGREDNNKNLNMYSMALTHILKKYKLAPGYNSFYCGMEKKTWVQKGNKVKNPFNDSMPGCGTKKTEF